MNTHTQTVKGFKLQSANGARQALTLCFIMLLFSACTKEKETERPYPRVATGLVTNINAEGATFSGSFLQAGKSEIIDHGFVFDVHFLPSIHSAEKISLGTSSGNGTFNATANSGFAAGKTYYVSAYAQIRDKIFYAEAVSFVSMGCKPPEIIEVVPGTGITGDTITIKGKYFSSIYYNNRVKFNDKPISVISATNTEITIRVPAFDGNEFADIAVTVTGKSAYKADVFRYITF